MTRKLQVVDKFDYFCRSVVCPEMCLKYQTVQWLFTGTVMWHTCDMFVTCVTYMWHTCYMWDKRDIHLIYIWHTCDTHVTQMWHVWSMCNVHVTSIWHTLTYMWHTCADGPMDEDEESQEEKGLEFASLYNARVQSQELLKTISNAGVTVTEMAVSW